MAYILMMYLVMACVVTMYIVVAYAVMVCCDNAIVTSSLMAPAGLLTAGQTSPGVLLRAHVSQTGLAVVHPVACDKSIQWI